MGKRGKKYSIPTIKHAGFAIRETKPGYYMVDSMVNGQRIRRGYCDLKEAKEFCETKRNELKVHGLNALILPESVKQQALKAIEILKPMGVSLIEAATEYATRHPATNSESFRDTCNRYLADMEKQGARDLSVKDKRIKFGKLCDTLGDKPTIGIDDLDLTAWTAAQGYTNGTARAYIGAAKSALAFYRGEKKQKRLEDEKTPETWTPDQVRKLMAAAEKDVPEFVAPLAVLFFAGCRPDEVKRLTWDNINLTEKHINLDGSITKTRTSRNIEIQDNLLAWLAAHKAQGPLVASGSQYTVLRTKAMKAAGIDGWPVDVARHTFATALYKATEDVGKVMAALGHFGSADTFTRHYKGVPMTKKQAAAYWKIKPAAQADSNVIQMKGAA